jgi:hypothetical protein
MITNKNKLEKIIRTCASQGRITERKRGFINQVTIIPSQ